MNKISETFIKHGKKVTYKNNDVIFNEAEICNKVGFIFKGRVKISTYTPDEGEVVINLLSENNVFGDLLIFSSNPKYYGIGVCLENSIIYYLNKEMLLRIMSRNIDFLNDFLNMITDKGVYLKQVNKLFAHKNIEERFTYYIYNIAKRINDDTIYYKSVTDLANILSIPRPSLSRVIHKMVREDKIEISKHNIKIKKN